MMIIDDINVFSCSIYCLRYVLMLLVLFSPPPPLIFIDAWWYYAGSCISCIPCLWKRCLLLLYFFLRQWCSLLLYDFLLTKTFFSLVDNLLFQICSNAVTANILLPGWKETIYLHFLIIVINHIRYFELVSSYSSHDFYEFFSVLGDLAVSLNLNPLYLMLPAAVIIINILMLIMIVITANQSWLSWCWFGWIWSCWSLIINADDDGSQVTCCYAFMLPVACPTNAIVYKASGSKIIMIMIMINKKYFLATSIL